LGKISIASKKSKTKMPYIITPVDAGIIRTAHPSTSAWTSRSPGVSIQFAKIRDALAHGDAVTPTPATKAVVLRARKISAFLKVKVTVNECVVVNVRKVFIPLRIQLKEFGVHLFNCSVENNGLAPRGDLDFPRGNKEVVPIEGGGGG
jgi:hypothetical protein